ncbi:MAG TPA: flavoprotein, partial [Kofleriaceae bacterium]|nr:flavoprotein [Kofleriaceae bacterium]
PGINIVVGVCGAIAASAAPALVTALQRRGHTVEVALTPTASRFVALDALSAILQREPQTSMWPRAPHVPVPHVALAAWADLVLVYPATATTIARLAHGDFSELVAATALTTRAPVVLAPSMNPEMLAAPVVERNLDQLRSDGFAIIRGVPAQEVADPPSLRSAQAGAAPAPAEVAATIDVLLAGDVLARRDGSPPARAAWQAVYRAASGSPELLPWASERCDDDIAAMLVAHAPRPPARLLDLGCGLGQVARHAAATGYRVVATDIAEAALELARDRTPRDADIIWLRDDIGATALVGPFDVIVDRATLHALSPLRAHAWASSIRRLTTSGGIVIVKAHRDGVVGATHGYSAERIAALLPDFELLSSRAAELPGLVEPAPIPSTLAVLKRR